MSIFMLNEHKYLMSCRAWLMDMSSGFVYCFSLRRFNLV